jgi:hypothetical protein
MTEELKAVFDRAAEHGCRVNMAKSEFLAAHQRCESKNTWSYGTFMRAKAWA